MYTLELLHRLIRHDRPEELIDEVSPVSFTMCLHRERGKLLSWTMEWIYSALALHEKLVQDRDDIQAVSVSNLISPVTLNHIRNKTFIGIEQYRKTKRKMLQVTLVCGSCALQRHQLAERCGIQDDGGLIIRRRQGRTDARNSHRGDKDQEMEREPEDLSDGEGESEINCRRQLLEMASRMDGKLVTGRKEPTRKSKPIQPYQFQEERATGVVKEFDPTFDSYHTGPTVEMLVEAHKELCLAFEFNPSTARWSTIGERFGDHGYRRTAGGFHQFYLNKPSIDEQLAHFFPLPPPEVLNQWKENRASNRVEGNDMENWTLGQMIGPEAGDEGTEKAMRTFVTGRTGPNFNNYIHLDLHASRKSVKGLTLSADIDSIIWITDRLKVQGSITIHLLPYKGKCSPIGKHNHAYVELYWPRTDSDAGRGELSRASQEVPVSNLPNTHFAHCGRTQGSAEIFVVFPRMKHKYPMRKMWETKIPSEVESFWLDNLVYPALKSLGPTLQSYTDFNTEDMKFKHQGSWDKGLQVSSQHLDQILIKIHAILEEKRGDEAYDRFGSLFFVLQIMGIKISTSLDRNWETLWDKLVGEHQALDWKYMEDEENGELLVDLGFGIHPPEGAQVVGFWDVEAIRAGYDYGSYSSGTTHGVSTISAIGGIHAEMGLSRRKRTHIAYRLTYNLAYEVLRGQKTRLKENFFPFVSAYQQDNKYKDAVDGVIKAFQRAMNKSYGSRDEYRCRASSIKQLLPLLMEKVRGGRNGALSSSKDGAEPEFCSWKHTLGSSTPSSGSPLPNGSPG